MASTTENQEAVDSYFILYRNFAIYSEVIFEHIYDIQNWVETIIQGTVVFNSFPANHSSWWKFASYL